MAFFVHAFVVGADAGDAVAVVKKFGAGESGEDGDAGFFDLAAQPLHEAIQRDDVVAMVAQRRRSDGQLELALLGEKVDGFFRDFGVERGFFLESGKQFAHGSRVEQRAGEAVLADLAGFFENVDVFFAELRVGMRGVMCVDKLRQAQRAGHAGRPAADDDYVGRHLRALDAFDRFAENQQAATDYRISGNLKIRGRSAFAFFTSSVNGGTMSNKFPTIA